jgi:nicotinamide-nucleotide amidase
VAADTAVALAQRLQETCLEAGLTVATAESCTGGLVAATLTAIPGSSGYVRGGIVAYADAVKQAALGVPADALATHGAVSAEVADAMARGARSRLDVDLAVSVTGVAGPGGGSAAKPVGLTFIAVADRAGVTVRRHVWDGDRDAVRWASVVAALEALLAAVSVSRKVP